MFIQTLLIVNILLLLVLFLFSLVSFVEYLVGAGMSYPDEAVRASVVYILVQLCVRKDDAVLALPLVHTMCRSLSVSLATSQSHELTINLMGEGIDQYSCHCIKLIGFFIVVFS